MQSGACGTTVTDCDWPQLLCPISILEPVPQPQALSRDQPKLDVHPVPQPLAFSKDMNYKQLAVWLRNHPSLGGGDYGEDISKLRGILPDTVVVSISISIILSL